MPIGVITAAVPQANASRIRPDAAPSRHSSKLTARSSTRRPARWASLRIESRVMPGRIVPVSGGVTRLPSSITKKMFMPPSSSTYLRSTASR